MARKFSILKKIIIVVLIVALLVTALLVIAKTSGEDAELNWIQRFARQTLSQFSQWGAGFAGFFDFRSKQALESEIQALKLELAEANTELQLIQEQAVENQRLRELLGYQDQLATSYTTLVAHVTGRNPDNWYNRLLLNKGSDDGIANNMVVVNQDGLVGRIVNVEATTCEVLLIIDAMGSLGGMIQSSRTQGVLEGIGGGKGLMNMKNLPYTEDIQINDVVVSSGVGGIFPAGLLVGHIVKVNTSLDGLSKQAVVEPTCDFDHLEEVLILMEPVTALPAGTEETPPDSEGEGGADPDTGEAN